MSSSLHIWADDSVLVASFGAHNAEPYTVIETNQLVGGIIKDITDELVDELDIEVSYIQTPRKRIERYLDFGVIHLVLISNPDWLPKDKQYQRSIPIFQDQDVLVIKSDNPKSIEKIEDI